ncbi:MAG: NusG domain II-containing protein [Ruminococcaceae bacterium]|nr:NusG domain II-containing protein [Oscillospiraceae bacterium]
MSFFMKNKKLKNDILLILALLVLAGAAYGILRLTREPGNEAAVTVDGQLVLTVPLSREATLTVGENLGFRNVVEVAGGRVRVSDADCPDRLCVRQGWISRDGESIVCLPHKLVVTVRGSEHDLDAVAR